MNTMKEDVTIKERYMEGLKYIYPQNAKEWRDIVLYRYSEDGDTKVIDMALKFMNSLDNKEDISAQYQKSEAYKFSDDFFAKLLKIVTKFSKRGVEFYYWAVEHRFARLVCGREESQIIKIAMQNRTFEKEMEEESTL